MLFSLHNHSIELKCILWFLCLNVTGGSPAPTLPEITSSFEGTVLKLFIDGVHVGGKTPTNFAVQIYTQGQEKHWHTIFSDAVEIFFEGPSSKKINVIMM